VIVVFDAQCLLCNGWVQFLLRHDRQGVVRFASIQGTTGKGLLAEAGLKVDGLQTLLVVDGARTWQHTSAILRVLHALGWPWRLAWGAWLVPTPLRDCSIAGLRETDIGCSAALKHARCHPQTMPNASWIEHQGN
jgi:predicted DCC family thiol-disulfide oxidoreductase YuxK